MWGGKRGGGSTFKNGSKSTNGNRSQEESSYISDQKKRGETENGNKNGGWVRLNRKWKRGRSTLVSLVRPLEGKSKDQESWKNFKSEERPQGGGWKREVMEEGFMDLKQVKTSRVLNANLGEYLACKA